ENGAALKRAARRVGADPEDMDADQDAEGRQDLREEGERRLRQLSAHLARRPAPIPVGGKRPHADHGENQHDLLQHGVEGAVGDQNGRDRIAEASLGQVLHRLRRQRRALIGQQQHDGGERQSDKRAKSSRENARGTAQGFLLRPALRCAQPRGGPDEQNAGDAAADRRLRQRHVNRKQAYPDERQQQSVDDIANRSREGPGRENGPGRDRENQEREANVERLQNAHAAVPLRRTARPTSCAALAPANWTSAQMATSLSAASGLSARGKRPSTTSPSPRLSALVSACRRLSASGKRNKPTVPAR